jgi:hypothetical protein
MAGTGFTRCQPFQILKFIIYTFINMRPKHLIIVASGLLVLCSALVIRQSAKTSRNMESPASVHPAANKTGGNTPSEAPRVPGTPAIQPATGKRDKSSDPSSENSGANSAGVAAIKSPSHVTLKNHPAKDSPSSTGDNIAQQVVSPPESTHESLPKGIQLADNVKLPAVILAINAAERAPQKKIPAPVAAAMHGIVDTFYQDLAESATKAAGDTSPQGPGAVTDATVSDTIVIHPGPAVEQARNKANETYRALFGDAAYDRMTMSALMESQLPAGPVTGGN